MSHLEDRTCTHDWYEVDHQKYSDPCKKHGKGDCYDDACWMPDFDGARLMFVCVNCEEVKRLHIRLGGRGNDSI